MKHRLIAFLITIPLLIGACAAPLNSRAPAPETAVDFGGDVNSSPELAMEEAAPSGDMKSSLAEDEAGERMVIKNADLSIVVEEPAQAMDEIMDMAEAMGGFVVSSNIYQTEISSGAKVPRARVTIRVPSENFNEALSEIKSGAGRVLSENISGEDVTREYTDLASRLRNLQKAETRLTEIMEDAQDTEDVLSVYNRLVEVQEEIELIKGQMQYFEQSVALSAISVDIQANEAVQPLTIAGWQPVGVAKNAIQALINTVKFFANALIWIGLFVLPVLIILYFPARWAWKGLKRLFGSGKSKSKNKQQKTESAE
jgi:hypothetical protein